MATLQQDLRICPSSTDPRSLFYPSGALHAERAKARPGCTTLIPPWIEKRAWVSRARQLYGY
jgi:hypothetical protein